MPVPVILASHPAARYFDASSSMRRDSIEQTSGGWSTLSPGSITYTGPSSRTDRRIGTIKRTCDVSPQHASGRPPVVTMIAASNVVCQLAGAPTLKERLP